MSKKSVLFLFLWLIAAMILENPVMAYDYVSNVEEMAHLNSDGLIGGGYIAPWFDPDSNNYFAFMACWDNQLAIIKTTDPANPQYITTFYGPASPPHKIQDVKVIGNYAYAADWGWVDFGWAKNLYILPLKSEYPYYDSSSITTIPFYELANTNIGSICDTIPLDGNHTLFADERYLYLTENGNYDAPEIAILDVSIDPLHPTLAGIIDTTGIEPMPLFGGAHSVFTIGDTIYAPQWLKGIYKLVVNKNNGFQVTSWGKILYDSWRGDVENSHPMLGTHSDSAWVVDEGPWGDPCGIPCTTFASACSCWVDSITPSSHSCYIAPNGYLLATDEESYNWDFSNLRASVAAILRVFKTTDFSMNLDTVPVYGAFDMVYKSSAPYLQYSLDISQMDDNWPPGSRNITPCPENRDCTDTNDVLVYMDLGTHDITVVGNLGFLAYHALGTHILDVADPTSMKYRGGIAHNRAPSDTRIVDESYAICISKDGYIYQSSGYDGLYIYRYGLTGTINSDTTWTSDVYIYDTLTVASNHRLELSAGTHIFLFKDAKIKVNGKLVASGTSSDSVKFTVFGGNPQPGDWKGIYVNEQAACSLSYCSVLNGEIGIESRTHSSTYLAYCNISHNSISGVYNYKGKLIAKNSRFDYNNIYGIDSYLAPDSIYNCYFRQNGDYGIYLNSGTGADSSFVLSDTIDCPSGQPTQYGIYVANNDRIRIYKCKIVEYEGGIGLDNSDANIAHNVIANAGSYGIYSMNHSRPKIRQCFIGAIGQLVGLKTATQGSANVGISADSGLCSFGPCFNYFIYHNYPSMTLPHDTLWANYNWYGSSPPNPNKFYVTANNYLFYDPWLRGAPPPPKLENGFSPNIFSLNQNYPNPFNPSTTISFALENPGNVTIKIYNILGQEVIALLDSYLDVGSHSIIWDGKNRTGRDVNSGIYFYTIRSGEHFESRQMTLLR